MSIIIAITGLFFIIGLSTSTFEALSRKGDIWDRIWFISTETILFTTVGFLSSLAILNIKGV